MRKMLLLLLVVTLGCDQPKANPPEKVPSSPVNLQVIKTYEGYNAYDRWAKFYIIDPDDGVKRTFLMHNGGVGDNSTESMVLLSTEKLEAEDGTR